LHEVDAKSILSAHNGMNIYRGCTHGCIYCDSRSKCYGFTHAFEDIEVKRNAPRLLEKALQSKHRRCMIGTGAMCDPYMPLEEETGLMRSCLEIIDRYEFGATVQTKSTRFLRDLDLFSSINRKSKAVIQMTLTTFDESLCRILEPNVSTTRERFEALLTCKEAGIPTVVWLSPILPFINDTEENIKGILDCCIKSGVKGVILFGMGLTLREGNREYFYKALEKYFPGMKERYIRTYGNSYEINSQNSASLITLFQSICQSYGILYRAEDCFSYLREFPENQNEYTLFDLL